MEKRVEVTERDVLGGRGRKKEVRKANILFEEIIDRYAKLHPSGGGSRPMLLVQCDILEEIPDGTRFVRDYDPVSNTAVEMKDREVRTKITQAIRYRNKGHSSKETLQTLKSPESSLENMKGLRRSTSAPPILNHSGQGREEEAFDQPTMTSFTQHLNVRSFRCPQPGSQWDYATQMMLANLPPTWELLQRRHSLGQSNLRAAPFPNELFPPFGQGDEVAVSSSPFSGRSTAAVMGGDIETLDGDKSHSSERGLTSVADLQEMADYVLQALNDSDEAIH